MVGEAEVVSEAYPDASQFDFEAKYFDAALALLCEPGDAVNQRRLPGAVRAEQCEYLTLVDLER